MKKQALTLVIALLAIFLVACNSDSSKDPDNKDIKKQVHEYSVGSFDETVNASITSHELIVQEDGVTKETYDLPADAFFVSIAPFETKTHECAVHSLTGCQGELVEEVFDVQITDEKGKKIVDEKMTSLENGYIDLWLPRDQEFAVKIQKDDKLVESTISTFEGDNTCITTMQLLSSPLCERNSFRSFLFIKGQIPISWYT